MAPFEPLLQQQQAAAVAEKASKKNQKKKRAPEEEQQGEEEEGEAKKKPTVKSTLEQTKAAVLKVTNMEKALSAAKEAVFATAVKDYTTRVWKKGLCDTQTKDLCDRFTRTFRDKVSPQGTVLITQDEMQHRLEPERTLFSVPLQHGQKEKERVVIKGILYMPVPIAVEERTLEHFRVRFELHWGESNRALLYSQDAFDALAVFVRGCTSVKPMSESDIIRDYAHVDEEHRIFWMNTVIITLSCTCVV